LKTYFVAIWNAAKKAPEPIARVRTLKEVGQLTGRKPDEILLHGIFCADDRILSFHRRKKDAVSFLTEMQRQSNWTDAHPETIKANIASWKRIGF